MLWLLFGQLFVRLGYFSFGYLVTLLSTVRASDTPVADAVAVGSMHDTNDVDYDAGTFLTLRKYFSTQK